MRLVLRVPDALDTDVRYEPRSPPFRRAGFEADVETADASGEFTVRAALGEIVLGR